MGERVRVMSQHVGYRRWRVNAGTLYASCIGKGHVVYVCGWEHVVYDSMGMMGRVAFRDVVQRFVWPSSARKGIKSE